MKVHKREEQIGIPSFFFFFPSCTSLTFPLAQQLCGEKLLTKGKQGSNNATFALCIRARGTAFHFHLGDASAFIYFIIP